MLRALVVISREAVVADGFEHVLMLERLELICADGAKLTNLPSASLPALRELHVRMNINFDRDAVDAIAGRRAPSRH